MRYRRASTEMLLADIITAHQRAQRIEHVAAGGPLRQYRAVVTALVTAFYLTQLVAGEE